jgi:hypothetical protein
MQWSKGIYCHPLDDPHWRLLGHRVYFLLQNWWEEKYFIQVTADYLASKKKHWSALMHLFQKDTLQ